MSIDPNPLFLAPATLPEPDDFDHTPELDDRAPADEPPTDDDQDPGSNRRRGGRGHEYTGPEYIRRADHLSRIGRRCDANGRTCIHNAATRRLTVVAADPATGEAKPDAVPYQVLSCSRHQRNWVHNRAYVVLNVEQLPPRESAPGRGTARLPRAVGSAEPDDED